MKIMRAWGAVEVKTR